MEVLTKSWAAPLELVVVTHSSLDQISPGCTWLQGSSTYFIWVLQEDFRFKTEFISSSDPFQGLGGCVVMWCCPAAFLAQVFCSCLGWVVAGGCGPGERAA